MEDYDGEDEDDLEDFDQLAEEEYEDEGEKLASDGYGSWVFLGWRLGDPICRSLRYFMLWVYEKICRCSVTNGWLTKDACDQGRLAGKVRSACYWMSIPQILDWKTVVSALKYAPIPTVDSLNARGHS